MHEKEQQIFDEVYNMKGEDIAGYLNYFSKYNHPFSASQHGERVYKTIEEIDCESRLEMYFNRYDLFRFEVDYYFTGFFKSVDFTHPYVMIQILKMLNIFMWKIFCVLGIVDERDFNQPKDTDNYLFM